MILKAFVLLLFLVSPLSGLVLLTLDLCLTYVSANKLAFAAFKKTSAKFNKGTANLQNIPVSKASYLKRDLRSY